MLFRKVAVECEFLRIMQHKKQLVVASSRKKDSAQVVNVVSVRKEWYIACRWEL